MLEDFILKLFLGKQFKSAFRICRHCILMHFNFLYLYWNTLWNIFAALMLLYFIASLLRNTVQVYILNKQMSHADSEHELKCVLIVYAFMHFNFVKLFLRIEWKYAFRKNTWIMQIYFNWTELWSILYNFVYYNTKGFCMYFTQISK